MQRALLPDGNRIRTLRLERGWPQEQLANIADLSPRTIQRVEAGGNASYETLRSIACAFEVEAKELLKERREVAASQTPEFTRYGAEIDEPNATVAISNRKPTIMNRRLWASLLATAFACLTYVPFPRSPGSEITTVTSNSTQAPSSVLSAGEAPPLERLIKLSPKSVTFRKSPQRQRRTIRAVEASPALQVRDTPTPNLATSWPETESRPSVPEPAEKLSEELAAANPIVSPTDCDEMPTPPGASTEAEGKKAIDYRSLSDAAVRFSKRTSGFFSRLGTAMKTSF
jgi:transcriptional regulator with XRE-family HTH domain